MPAKANGKAATTKTTFSRETEVAINIDAPAQKIWDLLTDAAAMPKWNSTIVQIDGDIAPGGKVQLVSTLDPKRTFKLKVKGFEPAQRLAWGDAMGTRVYTLEAQAKGKTRFRMHEKIGGPIFPLFARMIPSFDASFEQFAKDLKKAAET